MLRREPGLLTAHLAIRDRVPVQQVDRAELVRLLSEQGVSRLTP